jgi:hypothetical protein
LSVNNKVVERPYRYFNCGKTSLLVFRKVIWLKIMNRVF